MRLHQVSRAEATAPIVTAMYDYLFEDRDPVSQPGTSTGTRGDWWTVFANSPDVLEHAVNGFLLYQSPKRVLPPLLNDFVSLQKDSGLISILGVIDAIRAAQISTATDFNYTPYIVAGFLFVCLTIPLTRLTDWVARRQGWYGGGGSAV